MIQSNTTFALWRRFWLDVATKCAQGNKENIWWGGCKLDRKGFRALEKQFSPYTRLYQPFTIEICSSPRTAQNCPLTDLSYSSNIQIYSTLGKQVFFFFSFAYTYTTSPAAVMKLVVFFMRSSKPPYNFWWSGVADGHCTIINKRILINEIFRRFL